MEVFPDIRDLTEARNSSCVSVIYFASTKVAWFKILARKSVSSFLLSFRKYTI
jgi:hypothetical protein